MARRPTHTNDDYVDASLRYIDEHGLSTFTIRTLGESLGVDPTAVYRHFPSVADLAVAVLDRIFVEVVERPVVGDTPSQRLVSLLTNVHEVFYAHPNVLGILVTSNGQTPNSNQVSAQFIDLLAELGLKGEALVKGHRILESYVAGSHIFDLGGAPDHLTSRRARLRSIDRLVLDQHLPDTDTVERINREAFAAGLEALVGYCATLAI
jgi:AcrR family transcriptional regulator